MHLLCKSIHFSPVSSQGSFSIMPQGKGIALNPPVSSHLYRRLNNSQDGKVGYEFTRGVGR